MKKSNLLKVTDALAMPLTAIITVPIILLFITNDSQVTSYLETLIGALIFVCGAYITLLSARVISQKGLSELITTEIYEHTRNPFVIGLTGIILGEGIMLNSLSITAWAIIYLIINHGYIIIYEEKELKKKHGRKYENYRKKTPRWIPKKH